MSWFKRLTTMIFGKKDEETEKMKYFLVKWEQERKERMIQTEANIRDWLVALVNEKKQLHFSWESGNDEAFLSFKDYAEWDSNNFEDLEGYIIDKLDIPDAGEFEMTGEGFIYSDGKSIRASYQSIIKEMVDFNEETEEEIYGEEIKDKGDTVLFVI
jgi:hypothetical protein